jgi:hypothetical protein
MARKRKAKKTTIKRKRTAKKSKPKKRSTRKVDVLRPTVSDEELERSAILPATAGCTARHSLMLGQGTPKYSGLVTKNS